MTATLHTARPYIAEVAWAYTREEVTDAEARAAVTRRIDHAAGRLSLVLVHAAARRLAQVDRGGRP